MLAKLKRYHYHPETMYRMACFEEDPKGNWIDDRDHIINGPKVQISNKTLKVALWCVDDIFQNADLDHADSLKTKEALDELSKIVKRRESNGQPEARKKERCPRCGAAGSWTECMMCGRVM